MDSTTESRHGGARVRFPPPLVFLGFLGVGVALQFAGWPLPFSLPRVVTLSLGLALLAAALFFCFVPALRLFRATEQNPSPWMPSPSLIVAGPYRFTRNPMYVGMTLTQAALGLFLDNVWVFALAAVSLMFVHFIAVRPEEAYLAAKFGEPYRKYLASVRRYL